MELPSDMFNTGVFWQPNGFAVTRVTGNVHTCTVHAMHDSSDVQVLAEDHAPSD